MKTSQLLFSVGVILFFALSSCLKKPTACLNASKTTAKVRDTLRITSCSKNADSHEWEIDGDWPEDSFDDPFFGSHFVSSGGRDCDDFMEVHFYEPGTYSIELETPILSKGSCGSYEQEWYRSDETSILITITR